MPELPEVETTRRELEPRVAGHRIEGVELLWDGIVRKIAPDDFIKQLPGRKITGLGRRGKYLIFNLDSDRKLIIHMKMSGSLLFGPGDGRFIRAIVCLDNGKLYFRDPRKFGRMWLAEDVREVTGELGPEPLEEDFTPAVLAERLRGRDAPVKALITDQRLISGVGNMYADEALFEARMHPLRPGSSLTGDEIERLWRAIRHVLQAGIVEKGASIENYIRPNGEPGAAHYNFKVAHQRGGTCPECGGPIKRITVRGRGTYFCPRCQPEATGAGEKEPRKRRAPAGTSPAAAPGRKTG